MSNKSCSGRCSDAVWERVKVVALEDGFETRNAAVVDLLTRYGDGDLNVTARPELDLARAVAFRLSGVKEALDQAGDVIDVARVRELLLDLEPELLVEQVVDLPLFPEATRTVNCPVDVWQRAVNRLPADGFKNFADLFCALVTRYAARGIVTRPTVDRGLYLTMRERIETVLRSAKDGRADLVDLRVALNDVHPDVLARELAVLMSQQVIRVGAADGDISGRVQFGALQVGGREVHHVALVGAN